MVDRWHIIGRGSVGLLWASELIKQNHAVRLIVRDHQGAAVKQTIALTEVDNTQSTFNVDVTGYQSDDPISTLLVPLKAYDILPAIKQIKTRITPQTIIILCHNGMGTIEQVQQLLGPEQPLLFATTTHGGYRPDASHVRHTGLGETKVGWISPQVTNDLPQILSNILAPVSWHDDINLVLWQKLAINCVINPLTATKGVKNGQLNSQALNETITAMCQEIAEVANTCGIHFIAEALQESCYKVIVATAPNFSSMYQDIKAGRPTEIDYITGYLLEKAQQAGIKVAVNEGLYQQVKALESTS